MTSLALLIDGLVDTASAQDLWNLWGTACSPLQPGCGAGPANVFQNTLPNIAVFMLQIATALSVFYIVWAGVQLVTNMGDDGTINQQKLAIYYSVAGLFVCLASQLLVSFIATQDWGANSSGNLPVNVAAAIVGTMLIAFNGVLVLAILYYGVCMIMASGDSGAFNSARNGITWAIIGAIVVNLANALVHGITSFFGL